MPSWQAPANEILIRHEWRPLSSLKHTMYRSLRNFIRPRPDTTADMSEDTRRLKDFLASQPLPTLRILVLGAPGSGKRSVCEQLAHGVFPVDRDPTENGEYRRLIELFPPEEGRDFRVMLEWTTNLGDPKEMIPGILQQMVRDDEAHILPYRTANRGTFEAVDELWREHIAGRTGGKVFLVANGEDEGVTQIEGRQLADRLGATFWPLSAKTGDGAGEEQLAAMAKAILLHRHQKG
jgi:hypothetical protein